MAYPINESDYIAEWEMPLGNYQSGGIEGNDDTLDDVYKQAREMFEKLCELNIEIPVGRITFDFVYNSNPVTVHFTHKDYKVLDEFDEDDYETFDEYEDYDDNLEDENEDGENDSNGAERN